MDSVFLDCKPGIDCRVLTCQNLPPELVEGQPGPGTPNWENLNTYVIPRIRVQCGECVFAILPQFWEQGENTETTYSGEYNEIITFTSTIGFSPEGCGTEEEWNANTPIYASYPCCTSGYTATLTIVLDTSEEQHCLGANYGSSHRYHIPVTFSDSCGNNTQCFVPWADLHC